jgi:hypothetical protein
LSSIAAMPLPAKSRRGGLYDEGASCASDTTLPGPGKETRHVLLNRPTQEAKMEHPSLVRPRWYDTTTLTFVFSIHQTATESRTIVRSRLPETLAGLTAPPKGAKIEMG